MAKSEKRWVKVGKRGRVKGGGGKGERLREGKSGRVMGGKRGRVKGEKNGERLTGLWNCHARLVHRTCWTSRFSWLACQVTSKNNKA